MATPTPSWCTPAPTISRQRAHWAQPSSARWAEGPGAPAAGAHDTLARSFVGLTSWCEAGRLAQRAAAPSFLLFASHALLLASDQVNKRYRLLEIELDAIFRTMLLLKKKKYAAIKVGQGVGAPPGAWEFYQGRAPAKRALGPLRQGALGAAAAWPPAFLPGAHFPPSLSFRGLVGDFYAWRCHRTLAAGP
jgi:hypothetical protein